ncbi:MAG: VOC family protein [Thermoleophilia bacterium]
MLDLKTQGVFSWNELLTKDVEEAKKFYTKTMGWTVEEMPMGEMGPYIIFKVGDEQVAGMMTLPPDAEKMGAPAYWGAYISVDDVDATVAKVVELGGTVLVPPMDAEGVGRFATLQDPQGAVFGIIKSV